jgi:hypothetical protein
MQVDERVKKALAEFPPTSQDQTELARLQEFLQRMKDAGVARTREYDLPQPDTLGRSLAAGADKDQRNKDKNQAQKAGP